TQRSSTYCCKRRDGCRFASWHIVPCGPIGTSYSGRTHLASFLGSCIGSPALTPNDGTRCIRRREPVRFIKDDTRRFLSKWTLMSFAYVDMWKEMPSAPAWSNVPKTGDGRVSGGDTISVIPGSSTIGQSHARTIGSNMSTRLNRTRNWRQCDGRFDGMLPLGAM